MQKIELDKKQKISSIISIILILLLILHMIIDLTPLIKSMIENKEDGAAIVTAMTDLGFKGAILLVFLSILQIMSIVFPGAPIRILAGLSFGLFRGYLIIITGVVIGNIIIFILVRKFNNIIKTKNSNADVEKKFEIGKWNLVEIIKRGNIKKIVFFLILIPGVPKGLLPYIFANTSIKLSEYIPILILASTPMVFVSIMIGHKLAKSDLLSAIVMGLVLIVVSIIVARNKDEIMDFIKAK